MSDFLIVYGVCMLITILLGINAMNSILKEANTKNVDDLVSRFYLLCLGVGIMAICWPIVWGISIGYYLNLLVKELISRRYIG